MLITLYNGYTTSVEAPIIKCVSRVQIEGRAAAKQIKNSWPMFVKKVYHEEHRKIRISHSKRLCK